MRAMALRWNGLWVNRPKWGALCVLCCVHVYRVGFRRVFPKICINVYFHCHCNCAATAASRPCRSKSVWNVYIRTIHSCAMALAWAQHNCAISGAVQMFRSNRGDDIFACFWGMTQIRLPLINAFFLNSRTFNQWIIWCVFGW